MIASILQSASCCACCHTTRVREPVPIVLQACLSTHRLRPSRGAPSIMSMSPEPEEESAPASCTAAARVARPQSSSREAARAHGTLATKPARRPQREEPLRPRRDGAQPERRRRLPELPDALRRRGRGRRRREHLCGNQPVRRVHLTLPTWLGRAARNRHRHAIEQASRRWRGGRRDDSATQASTSL